MTVQSNIPSLVFLRGQSYDPPERQVDVVSGLTTVLASVLGPNAVSLPLPLMGIIAGPDAGHPAGRYRAAVVVGAALVIIGALGAVAVALLAVLPPPLIQALAGLALLRVLTSAVQAFARGPLILGPVLAMVVAQSTLTLLGLGPLFWALVIGIAVSRLLEHDGLVRLRDRPPATCRLTQPVREHRRTDLERASSLAARMPRAMRSPGLIAAHCHGRRWRLRDAGR